MRGAGPGWPGSGHEEQEEACACSTAAWPGLEAPAQVASKKIDTIPVRPARGLPAGMDCIPRQLSRAQTFDSLSSMANIAGYRWAAPGGGTLRC